MKPTPLVVPAALLVCLFGVNRASAQQAGTRVEVGGHAAILRLDGFNGVRSTTNGGFGGHVSFDLTNWVALEGEVTFFPSDKIARPAPFVTYRRRIDGLLGLKIAARGERMGVFLKARPGITYLAYKRMGCENDKGPVCALALPPPVLDRYRTEFAFEVGGGVEFYQSARTVARAEIGSTIIRHGNEAPPWLPPTSRASHNLSSRFGVGFRF